MIIVKPQIQALTKMTTEMTAVGLFIPIPPLIDLVGFPAPFRTRSDSLARFVRLAQSMTDAIVGCKRLLCGLQFVLELICVAIRILNDTHRTRNIFEIASS